MNKIVNFEDSIFLLETRLRIIRDSLVLDADPELFLEKLLDDIAFVDDRMRILLGQLQGSSRLIDREELLDQFSEAEGLFSLAMEELLLHEGDISIREIPEVKAKVTEFLANSQDRRKTALSLSSSAGSSSNGLPVVSTDELTELLKAF
ncbi:MAG: hypothetical protein FWH19_03620 [Treponema sp.]|nr:hypothetical protein [Treponema sp.]